MHHSFCCMSRLCSVASKAEAYTPSRETVPLSGGFFSGKCPLRHHTEHCEQLADRRLPLARLSRILHECAFPPSAFRLPGVLPGPRPAFWAADPLVSLGGVQRPVVLVMMSRCSITHVSVPLLHPPPRLYKGPKHSTPPFQMPTLDTNRPPPPVSPFVPRSPASNAAAPSRKHSVRSYAAPPPPYPPPPCSGSLQSQLPPHPRARHGLPRPWPPRHHLGDGEPSAEQPPSVQQYHHRCLPARQHVLLGGGHDAHPPHPLLR